ncbi:site-specific integrase [Microvirga sp. STS02]|uniref:site-specific integrase n=1 Tax=Hymenobacter negativus TaxID=2795026 RepID=UPI0018DCE06B|nr:MULTISPECIES: site-specific integrase [Bacteria]MBH8567664.1 site-specific integrase [Hymenobacter negativus]MBR7207398.1 site-specific integrase [Microvirga sp. STS02]
MASTKLVIRSDRKTFGKTTIYIQYTHKSIKKKFSTKYSAEPNRWDASGQQVMGSDKEVKALNLSLQESKARIDAIVRQAILNGEEPTFQLVEVRLKELSTSSTTTNKVARPQLAKSGQTHFLELFASYIEATSAVKANGTVKHYKSTLNHLKSFAVKYGGKLTLERVDIIFYNELVKHLTQGLKMTNGTVNNQLKRVKVVMSYAVDQGLTDNLVFRKFKLMKHTEADKVYLTQDEFQALIEADLTTEQRLEKVRDLFVLACATGLRHSDFSTIHPDNIEDDQLVLRMVKTRQWHRIDLNKYSRAILAKYPNGLPRLSQQKFNDYVKELGQYCGIDKSTLVVHYQGSKRIEERVPKFSLLSSHTGRHTFVTQSLERGMSLEVVQKFTGHKDLKSLLGYAKVVDKRKKSEMENAWG